MKTIVIETPGAITIADAADEILEVAKRDNACIRSEFNGHFLEAVPTDNIRSIIDLWDAASMRRNAAFQSVAKMEAEIAKLKREENL